VGRIAFQQPVLVKELVDLREDGLIGDRIDIEIEEIPVAPLELDETMRHLFPLKPGREHRGFFKRNEPVGIPMDHEHRRAAALMISRERDQLCFGRVAAGFVTERSLGHLENRAEENRAIRP
jgi:hypothetical protein